MIKQCKHVWILVNVLFLHKEETVTSRGSHALGRVAQLEGELQEGLYAERVAMTEGTGELLFAHPEKTVQGGGRRESESVTQEEEEGTAHGQTLVSQEELISEGIWMDLSHQLCQPFCSEHLLASLGPTDTGVNSPLAGA